MPKYDIDILMPTYLTPDLLRVSVPSLMESLTTGSRLIVLINSDDHHDDIETIEVMEELQDVYTDLWSILNTDNLGPSSVDYALPILDSKYVANVNSDMIFAPGWDSYLIETLERNYPASASCLWLENRGYFADYLGEFGDPLTQKQFLENYEMGKYSHYPSINSANHPILCRIEDFIGVGGYSDNFDPDWIKSRGRGLDDHFAWRLWKLHGGDFRFILDPRAVVFHGLALTSKNVPPEANGRELFLAKTGMTIQEWNKTFRYLELADARI